MIQCVQLQYFNDGQTERFGTGFMAVVIQSCNLYTCQRIGIIGEAAWPAIVVRVKLFGVATTATIALLLQELSKSTINLPRSFTQSRRIR